MRTLDEVVRDYELPIEQTFVVTFGVKWRREHHPQGMHPDGYAVIGAPNEMKARELAHEVFGAENWAFMYDHLDRQHPGRFHERSYPKGVLAVYLYEEESRSTTTATESPSPSTSG